MEIINNLNSLSNFHFKSPHKKSLSICKNRLDENELSSEINDITNNINNYTNLNNSNIQTHKIKRNYLENKKKVDEFHLQTSKNLVEEIIKQHLKNKLLNEKEKERQELLEKKRLEKIKENENLRNIHKQRHDFKIKIMEEKLRKNSELIQMKLGQSEIKRNKLEELRKMVFKKREDETLKKYEDIQKFFLKEKEKEEIRNILIEKKFIEMDNQKKLMDKIKDEEIKKKMIELKIKEKKNNEKRDSLEKEDDEKRDYTIFKINKKYYKFNRYKEEKERDLMFKNELNMLKRSEALINFKRIENIIEYENHRKREKIEDKYKRSQSFLEQKEMILSNKRFLSIDTSSKRQIILKQFDRIDKDPLIEVLF
jgi:hypothetical protein